MHKNSIYSTILSLIISLLGFINYIVLAKLFGLSGQIDEYLIASSIPILVTGLLVSALSYSAVPYIVSKQKEKDYMAYVASFLLGITCSAFIVLITGIIISPILVDILGRNLNNFTKSRILEVTEIFWIIGFTNIIIAALTAIHNLNKSFISPLIYGSIFPYVGMIIASIYFGKTYGIKVVPLGMLCGTVVAIPFLYYKYRGLVYCYKEAWVKRYDVLKYIAKLPKVMISMLCFTVFQSIDSYWAPKIGVGNLAALGYAQRMLIGFGALVITGPSILILPKLSELHVSNENQIILDYVERAIKLLLILLIPIIVIVLNYSDIIVVRLFQSGEFSLDDSIQVSRVLKIMIIGMVPMLSVVIIFKALYAKNQITKSLIIGIAVTLIYFLLSGIMSKIYGLDGIAYSYTITWTIILILSLSILWGKNLKYIINKNNILYIFKITAITSGIILLMRLIKISISSVIVQRFEMLDVINVLLNLIIYYYLIRNSIKNHDLEIIENIILHKCRNIKIN